MIEQEYAFVQTMVAAITGTFVGSGFGTLLDATNDQIIGGLGRS